MSRTDIVFLGFGIGVFLLVVAGVIGNASHWHHEQRRRR